MAKNTGEGHRVGSVKDRTQTEAPNRYDLIHFSKI